MKKGVLLLMAMLGLLLCGLTGCSAKQPVVMPEAQAILLEKGSPAPLRGWLLSESALEKLLEAAEK